MPLHINTPLLESLPLSQKCGSKVWMKMEAMQPSGSFKIRGIGHACEQHLKMGCKRFISSSGGNAGLAVAYSGRRLGVPVVVVVPETTSIRARQLLALENAHVIVHGKSWFDANEHARSLQTAQDAFIHPFDDPLLWQGHSSLIDEVLAEGINPDAVILSVGGGGLLVGVHEGLKRNGLDKTPIYAVETIGMGSYNATLKAGHLVDMPVMTGVAPSLGARRVCAPALELASTRPVHSILVNDRQAVNGCLNFLDDHRTLVEPACGASLAVLYEDHAVFNHLDNILLVVCGGSTATIESLKSFTD